MSSISKLLNNYHKSFGSSAALEALSKALAGQRVFHLGRFRTVVSVGSFVGGAGIYFGGPARGEDHGDTWIYLSEVVEQNGKLVHQPRSQDFEAGVQHERARQVKLLQSLGDKDDDQVKALGWDGRSCSTLIQALAKLIEKGEEGVDTSDKPE